MGKRDADHARNDIDKYRKQLGKQEFRGRNKRHALATKNRAQARRSESPLQTGLIAVTILVILLGLVYFFFLYSFKTK